MMLFSRVHCGIRLALPLYNDLIVQVCCANLCLDRILTVSNPHVFETAPHRPISNELEPISR